MTSARRKNPLRDQLVHELKSGYDKEYKNSGQTVKELTKKMQKLMIAPITETRVRLALQSAARDGLVEKGRQHKWLWKEQINTTERHWIMGNSNNNWSRCDGKTIEPWKLQKCSVMFFRPEYSPLLFDAEDHRYPDYQLEVMDALSYNDTNPIYQMIAHAALPPQHPLTSFPVVRLIVNLQLTTKFMEQKSGTDEKEEIFAFHGTRLDDAISITKEGFTDKKMGATGLAYGRVFYLTDDPCYSLTYGDNHTTLCCRIRQPFQTIQNKTCVPGKTILMYLVPSASQILPCYLISV